MRDRFISGMITGGLIGATAGIYTLSRMSFRQRRRLMKRGNKMIKGTANIIDMIQSIQ